MSTMSNQSSQTIAPQTNNHLGMLSSSPKIKKLSNGNWLAWKTRMAAVLKRKKAYEVALGITPKPSEPSTVAIWEDKDAIAQELITTVIRDEQVIHVSTCTTAAEMWDALRIIHEPQGQQSIISTKRALYSAQAKEGTDIAAHLNEMRQKRVLRLTRVEANIDS